MDEKSIKRFWERVSRKSGDECWEWTSCLSAGGYGQLQHEKRYWLSHRLSWVITNGEIPAGMWVLHTCDNRKCCNPRHLFLGTTQDNTKDMNEKGRGRMQKTGIFERKISQEQVSAMRVDKACGMKIREIMAKYGTSRSYTQRIVNGKRRKGY